MSQSTTDADARCSQDDMRDDDAQRWPTPSDGSVPCTQQSYASDSQLSKEDDLAAVELKLERMGYRKPFPSPLPIEFEYDFPLPEGRMDHRFVQGERVGLETTKDELWEVAAEQRRKGRNFAALSDAREATRRYVAYLEKVHSREIIPVDGASFRQEANKLAAMRMYLLEALADEAIKRRAKFD
jgi:hypothetical protein